jgi:lipopolysaccharide transport system permease protein
MFATPVAYPSSIVPEQWRAILGLNPMAGVVEGFRWALLGHVHPSMPLLSVSIAAVSVLLVGGVVYFRKTEATFADLV